MLRATLQQLRRSRRRGGPAARRARHGDIPGATANVREPRRRPGAVVRGSSGGGTRRDRRGYRIMRDPHERRKYTSSV